MHENGELDPYEAVCPDDTQDWGHARLLSAMYRLERKKLLENVVYGLRSQCVGFEVINIDVKNFGGGVNRSPGILHDEL